MNAEAIAALDDPALTVPRVLDVHGTLLRLGFKYWDTTKITSLRSGSFYRLFVKLFHPVDPPIIQRERRVSHVEFFVTYDSDECDLIIHASFGYPERYRKKLKIIECFQKMLSDSIHERISLHNHDDRLRNVEARLKQLIERLATKRVDCTLEKDSATGLVKATIPEHEALRQVVANAIDCHTPSQPERDWWLEEERIPPQKQAVFHYERESRFLPSWDNRRAGFRRSVRRGI